MSDDKHVLQNCHFFINMLSNAWFNVCKTENQAVASEKRENKKNKGFFESNFFNHLKETTKAISGHTSKRTR